MVQSVHFKEKRALLNYNELHRTKGLSSLWHGTLGNLFPRRPMSLWVFARRWSKTDKKRIWLLHCDVRQFYSRWVDMWLGDGEGCVWWIAEVQYGNASPFIIPPFSKPPTHSSLHRSVSFHPGLIYRLFSHGSRQEAQNAQTLRQHLYRENACNEIDSEMDGLRKAYFWDGGSFDGTVSCLINNTLAGE